MTNYEKIEKFINKVLPILSIIFFGCIAIYWLIFGLMILLGIGITFIGTLSETGIIIMLLAIIALK